MTDDRADLAANATAPAWELRNATVDDVEAIAQLWHVGWADGHRGHVPEALHEHRRIESFRPRVASRLPMTTVAMVGPMLIGFVVVRDDELEQLYVAANARGGGVAAALIDHGEVLIARDHDRAWLAVVEGNTRARRFYERRGWHDAGPLAYLAETSDGGIRVACRRYEKRLWLTTSTV